jgi:hypothetical protein
MVGQPEHCPLCAAVRPVRYLREIGLLRCECSDCGMFFVSDIDVDDFLDNKVKREKSQAVRLSALTREQTIRGWPPFYIQFSKHAHYPVWEGAAPISVEELLARWPATVTDRLNRVLCNYARSSKFGGAELGSGANLPLLFAERRPEALFHMNTLKEKGLIAYSNNGHLYVTANGWAKVEELERGRSSPENPVFVAMWFGGDNEADKKKMKALFDIIDSTVRETGYTRSERADGVEHNDFIVDKVMAKIRAAPFVIADFTNHNRGVYFEAGFARGLGIEVIHCCPKDQLDHAHFDVKQLNTILYKDVHELHEKLKFRILNSLPRNFP